MTETLKERSESTDRANMGDDSTAEEIRRLRRTIKNICTVVVFAAIAFGLLWFKSSADAQEKHLKACMRTLSDAALEQIVQGADTDAFCD
jgi:hypothetical protein